MKDIAGQDIEFGDFVMGSYINNNKHISVIGIVINIITEMPTCNEFALVKYRQYDRSVTAYIKDNHVIKLPEDYIGNLMFTNPDVLPIIGD